MRRKLGKCDIPIYRDRESGQCMTDGLYCYHQIVSFPNHDMFPEDPLMVYTCCSSSDSGECNPHEWREIAKGWLMTDEGPLCTGCQQAEKLSQEIRDRINSEWGRIDDLPFEEQEPANQALAAEIVGMAAVDKQ